jgi:putative ATPase
MSATPIRAPCRWPGGAAGGALRRLPEARINLAQGVTYLATAPKSNASYIGIEQALAEVRKSGALPVPLHIRNAPTRLMKELGYHKGYKYAHDYADGVAPQEQLPEALAGRRFYRPTERGYEKLISERLQYWEEVKKGKGSGGRKPEGGEGD